MIPKKTVLILGAGASVPFGFPTGRKLLKTIVADDEIGVRLREQDYQDKDIQTFRDALKRSGRPSVDAFLEKRPQYLAIGTAAIAAALLPCEREDMLFDYWLQAGFGQFTFRQGAHESPKPPDEGSWYESLFDALDAKVSFENFGKANDKLSVITFNYDRSLEHYLHTALGHAYGKQKEPEECAEQLRHIKILHVYGSLGKLDWQTSKSYVYVPYGSHKKSGRQEQSDFLERASNNISIFLQTDRDNAKFKQAFELLEDARQIYFLGFGYHATNVERLKIESLLTGLNRDIRGTRWKLSKLTLDYLGNLKATGIGPCIELTDKETTVYDFVEHEVNLRA